MGDSSVQLRVPTLPTALPPSVGTNGLTMTSLSVENTTKCNGTNALTAVVANSQQQNPPAPQQTTTPGQPVGGSVGNSESVTTTPARRTTKDFIFGHVIGEGSFSTVYLTKDIHSAKEYAIKVCEKRHIMREKKSEYVKREKDVLNILSSAQTPFFVKLYCTFQDAERLYFVLSYAKNGELLQYISKLGNFDIACTRFYAGEIVLALEHLHRLGIIHRDLKPENILLDDKMHILITDFGSAKIVNSTTTQTTTPETNGDVSSSEQEQHQRPTRRRNSFVGTAQYVSPELLTDKTAHFASDLWALGCIIYQMISGLPPFRARTEYAIFQKIIKLEYEFPEGFDSDAQDLVQKLLVVNASERLGAQDTNGYPSVKNHPMFSGLDFGNILTTTPPPISPFMPMPSSNIKVPDHLEPGLDKQLSRLLGLESERKETPVRKKSGVTNILTAPELAKARLDEQRQTSKWHHLVSGHLILKQGLVNKRKGLFARRRMLLLTEGPHLYYVDPDSMTLKGEIPWSQQISAEAKNFKIFFVHTPNRTYYLEDPEGYALEWCKAIDEVKMFTYGP
ncbi:phosphoinositide-dependent kinase 1 isoform X2 [Rhodnius prolixus]|uniref:phosphoinositide-dependent kinase 1 isoform X2 n=1 Tax=Rhodnius prolixus TaxID=13249 RepID=UPI003D188017